MKSAKSTLSGFRRHNGLREEETLLDEVCSESLLTGDTHPIRLQARMSSASLMPNALTVFTSSYGCLSCVIDSQTLLLSAQSIMSKSRVVVSGMPSLWRIPSRPRYSSSLLTCKLRKRVLWLIVSHVCAFRDMPDVSFSLLDGVHVIHQPTQAGRTLVGFLLNCQSDLLRPLIAPALYGLKSCVGLLRCFSDRYVCGRCSCDMMEEFRIT